MKSVITMMSVFFLTCSAWAGTFVETFDNKDLEGWQEIVWHDAAPGSWENTDGELHAINNAGVLRLLTTGDKTWRNYTIEFDVKPLKKHGAGSITIAARIKGTALVFCEIGDLPFFILSSVTCRATSNFHDKHSQLLHVESHSLLKIEDWSTLKLGVQGEVFIFWINGKRIVQTGDDFTLKLHKDQKTKIKGKAGQLAGFLTGGAGLGLANYTARFDNIIITGDGIPDKGALSVTPRVKLATTWGRLKQF
ncbi:MAG: DUF1080 domain-containing protein [Candidatus Poribacteria bacterium]|nr:DUF1080 domain-containing protein [Candidatus Poribacteria bacterium]